MFQQLILVGNLGNDPELRYTNGGTPVAHFDLAVNKDWKDSAGEKQSKTVWVRVTVWRTLAENCANYLSKGKRVLVVAELGEPNAYLDKEGNPRATNEVTGLRVTFLSPITPGQGVEGEEGTIAEDGTTEEVESAEVETATEESPF